MLSRKDQYIVRRERCRTIIRRLAANVDGADKPATREQLRAIIDYFGITLAETGGFCCDWTPELGAGRLMQIWLERHGNEVLKELEREKRIHNCEYLRVEK